MMNGTRITSKDQWICRRAETNVQLQMWELGMKPGKPQVLTGAVTQNAITVTAGDGTTSITFTAQYTLPSTGAAPYPSLIGVGGVSLNTTAISALGVAIIQFNNNDIALQNGASSRGIGKFYTLYGANHTAGAMMAWAWAVSRILDVIEQFGGKTFDMNRIGVTGCSRNGKVGQDSNRAMYE